MSKRPNKFRICGQIRQLADVGHYPRLVSWGTFGDRLEEAAELCEFPESIDAAELRRMVEYAGLVVENIEAHQRGDKAVMHNHLGYALSRARQVRDYLVALAESQP